MIGATATFEDGRRHPRMNLRTELWIGQDGIFTRTNEFLRDLSVGGAFVQSEQVHAPGTILSFRFKLPIAPNMVSCSGIVGKIHLGEGYSIQFLDMSRENVSLIERQIEAPDAPAAFSY
jgi:PilZ domain